MGTASPPEGSDEEPLLASGGGGGTEDQTDNANSNGSDNDDNEGENQELSQCQLQTWQGTTNEILPHVLTLLVSLFLYHYSSFILHSGERKYCPGG